MKLLKVKIGDAEVANQESIYKNFTGTIDWKGSKGQVKNADFELDRFGIRFKSGTWESGVFDGNFKGGTWLNGVFDNGYFEGGTWKNGTWRYGYFQGGIWENGTWKDGYFEGGTWKNGTFSGVFKDGTWLNGVFDGGNWWGGNWKNGWWKNGIWEKGEWEKGLVGKDKKPSSVDPSRMQTEVANQIGKYRNFTGTIDWKGNEGRVKNADFVLQANGYAIEFEDGTWLNGVFDGGNWQGGTWKNGWWKNGIWEKGTWQGGTWKNGTWKNGTWQGGTWKNGNWWGGNWKNGTWEGGEIKGNPSTTPPAKVAKNIVELAKKASKELASFKLGGELPRHTKRSGEEYFSWFSDHRGRGLYMTIDYDDATLVVYTDDSFEKTYKLSSYRSVMNKWKKVYG